MDVTTYLLHRMLGAPAQLPDDDATRLVSVGKKTEKDAEDKHSEAGTYTIDEDEDDAIKHSVQQARECIDDVFGITDAIEHKSSAASSHLVRPVIGSERTHQDHGGTSGLHIDADEDVFIHADADDVQQQQYVCILMMGLCRFRSYM